MRNLLLLLRNLHRTTAYGIHTSRVLYIHGLSRAGIKWSSTASGRTCIRRTVKSRFPAQTKTPARRGSSSRATGRPSLLLAQRRAIDLTWSYRRTLGAQTTTDHLTSLIVPTCRRRAWILGPKLHLLRLVVNGFAVQRASATNQQQVEVR